MKYAFTLLVCLISTTLFGQQSDTLLQEVTVVDTRYAWLQDAQFTIDPDSIERAHIQVLSMADWLPNESSVHVRQYAPGMAATYSAHGATSAQNAVLWGGITINNPAIGSSDLALLPFSLFEVGMVRGGSAALFGTGAMGSVMNLKQPSLQPGWHIQLAQRLASFNTFQTSTKLSYQNKRFTSITHADYSNSQNNYTYNNPYRTNSPLETRMHAAFNTLHLQQQLSFQVNETQFIDGAIWYSQAERETPNSTIVGIDGSATLYDRTLRSRVGWHYQHDRHQVDVVYGYLSEWQRFHDLQLIIDNEEADDTNTNSSHVVRADWLFAINKQWYWQSGIQVRHDDAGGSNRTGTQTTSSLQSGIKYAGNWVHAQAVIRYENWDGQSLPLSPFVSAELPLPLGLKVTAFGGYNYRIPGMNDRFWNPGGNPELEPEQGWSYEAAFAFEKTLGLWRVNARAAYYKSIVDNYILWLPSGAFWSPHNVRRVDLSGIDFDVKTRWTKREHIFQIRASYSYNQSIVQASHRENDNSVGKQLTYQPVHKTTGSVLYGFKKLSVNSSIIQVGEVRTNYSETGNPLDSYMLLNTGLGYAFSIKKSMISIQLSANNLFDVYYENIAFFPMPGRHYSVTLKFTL